MSYNTGYNKYKICGDYTILYIHIKNQEDQEIQLENLVAKLQCQLTEAQLKLKEIRQE